MKPTDQQLQQFKIFHRQQSAAYGAGVVAFAHGSAVFVPTERLHTLPVEPLQVQRMINYASSRNDDSFVLISDHDVLVITND